MPPDFPSKWMADPPKSKAQLLAAFSAARDAVLASVGALKLEPGRIDFGNALGDMFKLRTVLHGLMDYQRPKRSILSTKHRRRQKHKTGKKHLKVQSVYVVNTGQSRKVGSHRSSY